MEPAMWGSASVPSALRDWIGTETRARVPACLLRAGTEREGVCHSRRRVFIKYPLLALVIPPGPRAQASPISPRPSALLPALPFLEVSLLERSQDYHSGLSVRAHVALSSASHTHMLPNGVEPAGSYLSVTHSPHTLPHS